MAWAFDPRAHRYRDTESGQFLSQARARELVGQSILATGNATDELARLVASGMLSPADWQARMREEIKGEVIRQYVLGRGGLEQMTAEDWGSVGGMISDQYRHLDRKAGNFMDQVESGELTEGEIARRARMYINSAREGHERALMRRLAGSEYDEERWNNTVGETCDDCVDLADLGWVPVGAIGQVPGDGRTQCKTNCRCHKSYRAGASGRIFGDDWE